VTVGSEVSGIIKLMPIIADFHCTQFNHWVGLKVQSLNVYNYNTLTLSIAEISQSIECFRQ